MRFNIKLNAFTGEVEADPEKVREYLLSCVEDGVMFQTADGTDLVFEAPAVTHIIPEGFAS